MCDWLEVDVQFRIFAIRGDVARHPHCEASVRSFDVDLFNAVVVVHLEKSFEITKLILSHKSIV